MDAPTRLGWIKLYEEIGNAGVACRRCGISRPTLRKWWRRYQAQGTAGLEEQSRRPAAQLPRAQGPGTRRRADPAAAPRAQARSQAAPDRAHPQPWAALVSRHPA